MPGHGRSGKPNAGFPPRPQPLEIAQKRDSHIPTAPTRSGKVENEKHVSHFSARCLWVFNNLRKEAWPRVASLPRPGSFFDEKMLYRL